MEYRTYSVDPSRRQPLVAFIVEALEMEGCRIIHSPDPGVAPFRFTFETPDGERMGIVAYAFTANSKVTRNRPADEHRFQVKYGTKSEELNEVWQDPYGLYTTLFVGINPNEGFFVGADPEMHNPTRFFISVEFKQSEVDEIKRKEWHSWERDRRSVQEPVEVLVGGTKRSFLRYIRFEREALGEGQGHRQLLAEKSPLLRLPPVASEEGLALPVQHTRLHALAREFELSPTEVLDLIGRAPRLKMAVRGWVAEEHLARLLAKVPGVTECVHVHEEGAPDIRLRFRQSRLLTVECKNVLRHRTAKGEARLDFQRTRASKADPSSRNYSDKDFDVVAACLHAVTERWEFRYVLPGELDPHPKFPQKIASNIRVDDRWSVSPEHVLAMAARR